jgi:hypothetical protein
MKAIHSLLLAQDIPDVSMETILPNMEDVFISLIEEVDRRNMEKKNGEVGRP